MAPLLDPVVKIYLPASGFFQSSILWTIFPAMSVGGVHMQKKTLSPDASHSPAAAHDSVSSSSTYGLGLVAASGRLPRHRSHLRDKQGGGRCGGRCGRWVGADHPRRSRCRHKYDKAYFRSSRRQFCRRRNRYEHDSLSCPTDIQLP